MAFTSHLRRLSSFAIRSLGSSSEPRGAISAVHLRNRRLLGAQPRQLSTNPDDHKKPEKPFEGLPGFGDVIYKDGLLTLTRKTKDEIIKVNVKRTSEYTYKKNKRECLSMQVRIRYGEGFRKWMELEILVFPDEQDQIAIRDVSMSVLEPKWYEEGTVHIEELEDFFKKRGIEHQNLNFLFDYIEKLKKTDGYEAECDW